MSRKFEWQTAEEELWRQEPPPPPTAQSRRSWPIPLILLLLVAIGAVIVYRQAQQRIAATAAMIEADVQAAHTIVQTAAAQRDTELFHALLSGRDADWAGAQEQLVAQGLLFAPAPLGFMPIHHASSSPTVGRGSPVVSLSPDLNEAELSFEQPYTVQIGRDMTATVSLQQAAVYRRGDQRWLYAPPLPEFWGDWLTSRSHHLTLIYPQRDREIAERLAADLEAQLVDTCHFLTHIVCPADLRVTVRLAADPASLLALTDRTTTLTTGLNLQLPTPTLVGLPLDETGYQALYRGYAIQVVSAAITHLVQYQCCRHSLFYLALLDRQLEQLGLRPWPLTAADYEQALAEPLTITDTLHWYDQTPPPAAGWQQVYTLIEFLLESAVSDASEADLQRALNQSQGFWQWVYSFVEDVSREELVTRLHHFTYHQLPQAQTPPPRGVLLPQQPVELFCGLPGNSEQHLIVARYSPADEVWTQPFTRTYSRDEPGYVLPLPNNAGYAIQEVQVNNGETKTHFSLWRQGRQIPVFTGTQNDPDELSGMYYAGRSDPTGRYLLLLTYDEIEASEIRLLDTSTCNETGCDLQPLPGWLVWSPDSRHTLLQGRRPTTTPALDSRYWNWLLPLYRADALGQSPIEVGAGAQPFWLDNETYGYVRLSDSQTLELVTAKIHDDIPHAWLAAADLLAAMPADETGAAERPEQLFIWEVLANATTPHRLLLMTTATSAPSAAPYYFFLVTADNDPPTRPTVQFILTTDFPAHADFSPDGHWLAILSRGVLIHLLDLVTGEVKAEVTSGHWGGWSADGQWIAQQYNNYLTLFAPAHNYRQYVFRDLSTCYHVIWASGDQMAGDEVEDEQ